jgi:hypothetical protein
VVLFLSFSRLVFLRFFLQSLIFYILLLFPPKLSLGSLFLFYFFYFSYFYFIYLFIYLFIYILPSINIFIVQDEM